MRKSDIEYGLYLVTDRELLGGRDLVKTVEQAIQGGVTIVQVREKQLSSREFFQVATAVKGVTEKYKVPLIINDRADIAVAVDADGLHIGQDDLPVAVARSLVGPDKIIGVSTATLEEALLAQSQGADYLGVGAIFPTNTKGDADKVSLAQLQDIKAKVNIPVVAIGGINNGNMQSVAATGVDGAAVVSAIIAAVDPYKAAAELRQLIKRV